MYATTEEQRKLIHDCFNGNTDRDCENCPAHHTNMNGKCCFGDEEEYDDEDENCQKCPHQDDCALSVAEQVAAREEAEIEKEAVYQSYAPKRTYPIRTKYRTTVKPQARTMPVVKKRPDLVQIGGLRQGPPVRLSGDQEDFLPHDTYFGRFMKESARGGLIGFFEMAAEFFRTHRLP